jgi:hypothetical protein
MKGNYKSRACSTHGELINATFLFQILEARNYLGDIIIDERNILK